MLTFFFLAGNVFSPEIISIAGKNNTYGVVYAIGRKGSSGSIGGFKSGSFKSFKSSSTSKSSTGGFKTGSFKSSKSTSIPKTSKSFSGRTKKTYIPIPIPIPSGSHRYYGPSYGHFSTNYFGAGYIIAKIIGGIVKFILFIIVFIFILNIIKRIRRY